MRSNVGHSPAGTSASHCQTRSPSQPSTRDPSSAASRYRFPGASVSVDCVADLSSVIAAQNGQEDDPAFGGPPRNDHIRSPWFVGGNCPLPRTVPVSVSRVQSAR